MALSQALAYNDDYALLVSWYNEASPVQYLYGCGIVYKSHITQSIKTILSNIPNISQDTLIVII